MTDDGQDLLARARQDRMAWRDVACLDSTDSDGHWTDVQATSRYAILLALQYDLRDSDLVLVRFLFEQEMLRHRHEPFQGLFPALGLAAFLLATFRQVEHVWDFAQTKLSNFDTFLGFDVEFLVSAGIAATLDAVRTSEHPLREQVLEWLVRDAACVISDDDLGEWWARQREQYPTRFADEPPRARLDQALELGNIEEARRWLEVWEDTLERTASHLRTLAWYWAEVQDWDRAAAITEERLRLPDLDPTARAIATVNLVEYQRPGGHLGEAWRTLQDAEAALDAGDWWRAGLGRSAIEEALLLAQELARTDMDSAQAAYRWAARHLAHLRNSTVHLVEVAAATAAALGDQPASRRYHERAVRGRRRIARQLDG